MPLQLTICDQEALPLGRKDLEFVVYLPESRLSVRELISQRVRQEVAAYNERGREVFRGLVRPGDAERVLNGYRIPRRRAIDAEEQVQMALQAFESNGFILLINDRQVDNLDQVVELTPASQVTFLKLMPLVGG